MNGPRVVALAGLGIEVPDVEVGRAFYTAFGLGVSERAGALSFRGSDPHSADLLVLQGGPAKRLHHVAFHAHERDLPAIAERAQRLGAEVRQPEFAGIRPGLWLRDPFGTWFSIAALPPGGGAAAAGAAPAGTQAASDAGRIDVHKWQTMPTAPQPRSLGHMLMFSPDWERAEAWLQQALGLRTSDRAAGKVAFMSAGEGDRNHHCFGLINSTHAGFQHASFDMGSIDAIGMGVLRMRDAGFRESFGPGRHALGSNLFHYVRDPWGSWVEYYADMDRISESWQARDWNALPYVWGPEWNPKFWGQEMNGNLEPR